MNLTQSVMTMYRAQQPPTGEVSQEDRAPRRHRARLHRCLAALVLTVALTANAAESILEPPSLWLSANRQVTVEIGQGWPLLITVQLLNEQLMLQPGTAQTQALSSVTGNWRDSLILQVTGPSGTLVEWPAQAVNEAQGALLLTRDSGGQAGWWIAPEITAACEPGLYRMQCALTTTNAAEGWIGVAKSQSIQVMARSGSSPWSDESAAEKVLLEAEYAAWQGNVSAAVAALDSLLAAQPNLFAARSRKADFLLATGQHTAATLAYQSALEEFLSANAGTDAEPPTRLLRNRRSLVMNALFAPNSNYAPVEVFLTNEDQITLRWLSVAGSTYQVESSPDLENWTLRTAPLEGNDNPQLWTTTCNDGQQFFRIRITR